MKFIAHLVGLLKTDEGMVCSDLQLKGAGLKAFIDFTSENKEYNKNRLLYKLIITLEPKKKGAVKYVVPVFKFEEVTEEEAKEILQKADECVEKFEEFRKAYNNRGTTEEHETEEEYDEELPY